MMASQFNIDVAGQLEELIPQYDYTVPSFILGELEDICDRSQGKTRTAARTALKIAGMDPLTVKDIPLLEGESVDDALLRISHVLCTNDRELRRRAREGGIPVIYLRQRKYLTVDGYI